VHVEKRSGMIIPYLAVVKAMCVI